MSYLMKALEKAEKERAKQQGPDGSQQKNMPTTQASLPTSLVVGICILLVAAVGSSIWLNRGSSESSETLAESDSVSEEKSLAEAEQSEKTVIESNSTDDAIQVSSPVVAEANTMETASVAEAQSQTIEPAAPPRIYDIIELDAITLRKLPTIEFQGHIYSSAAEYRTVQINNRTLSEGMLLAPGVQLVEITPTGIVLSVANKHVSLPKGQDWIAPQ